MTEGGSGLLLRLSLFLLLLGLASLQLQTRASWKFLERSPPKKISRAVNPRRVKHKELVAGPAAGQGLPGRVQCNSRGVHVHSKNGKPTGVAVTGEGRVTGKLCLDSRKEILSFVTLFVLPVGNGTKSPFVQHYHELDKGMPYSGQTEHANLVAVLNIFLESINVSMPGTQVIVITDPHYEPAREGLPQHIVWKPIAGDYSRSNLMIQRLVSYIDLLESMLTSSNTGNKTIMHIVFTDFDMIVMDDIGCIFEDYPAFDVALTYRNNFRQPINSGVIMVRGTPRSLSRGNLLLRQALQVYHAKFRYASGVLGDQLALADVVRAAVDSSSFQRNTPFEAFVMTARTLFLPCSIFNWTPSEGAGQFHGMPKNVKVLHFKGSRKRLMVEAWSLFKEQGIMDFSNMKCLVLQSGRSKYEYL